MRESLRAIIVCLFLVLVLGTQQRVHAEETKPIEIHVDLSEAPRKLFKAQLKIPAQPGPLTLYYPKWIQGEHQPSGPINDLSGLQIHAAGKLLDWKRNDLDLYAFQIQVPEGASEIEVSLEYLLPGEKVGYGAGPASTAKLAILNWYLVTLYPKQGHVRDVPIRARLTLPPHWQAGTALPMESNKDGTIQFKTVSLETLADSPALCGLYFKEIPLGPKDGPPHYLVLACDSEAGLKVSDELVRRYEKLVAEAGALFGARHYRSYRFLVALTNHFPHNAIEHHECSDNRMPEKMFTDEIYQKTAPAWVLPHEYVHSWNGKYRRPQGLSTSDFQEPMQTRLIWVYEGLTEYLGFVLAARSGLYSAKASHENLAWIAEWAKNQVGRNWRPLEDTSASGPHLYNSRSEWSRKRRGVDFYDEGALLWLDADTLIREKTGGKKCLDDFCKAFHGGKDGGPEVKPYSFEDVVASLNGVVEHDWKGFLEKRLRQTSPNPPLDGITRGGWKVEYTNARPELYQNLDSDGKQLDLTASLGLLLKDDGTVVDVVPGKAADNAGIGPHMRVIAVNERKFTEDRLREALKDKSAEKFTLLVENAEYFKTIALDYRGGDKYPTLIRDPQKPDLLGDIFKPKTGGENNK